MRGITELRDVHSFKLKGLLLQRLERSLTDSGMRPDFDTAIEVLFCNVLSRL